MEEAFGKQKVSPPLKGVEKKEVDMPSWGGQEILLSARSILSSLSVLSNSVRGVAQPNSSRTVIASEVLHHSVLVAHVFCLSESGS
jgi:hypothetical protein